MLHVSSAPSELSRLPPLSATTGLAARDRESPYQWIGGKIGVMELGVQPVDKLSQVPRPPIEILGFD